MCGVCVDFHAVFSELLLYFVIQMLHFSLPWLAHLLMCLAVYCGENTAAGILFNVITLAQSRDLVIA